MRPESTPRARVSLPVRSAPRSGPLSHAAEHPRPGARSCQIGAFREPASLQYEPRIRGGKPGTHPTKDTNPTPTMQPHEGDQPTITPVGIDVSKDHLDAFYRTRRGRKEQARKGRFANTPEGHRALIAWIGVGPARACLEASGLVQRRHCARSV